MAYETILTERRGDVLVVTINRPERLNAAPPRRSTRSAPRWPIWAARARCC